MKNFKYFFLLILEQNRLAKKDEYKFLLILILMDVDQNIWYPQTIELFHVLLLLMGILSSSPAEDPEQRHPHHVLQILSFC